MAQGTNRKARGCPCPPASPVPEGPTHSAAPQDTPPSARRPGFTLSVLPAPHQVTAKSWRTARANVHRCTRGELFPGLSGGKSQAAWDDQPRRPRQLTHPSIN